MFVSNHCKLQLHKIESGFLNESFARSVNRKFSIFPLSRLVRDIFGLRLFVVFLKQYGNEPF